MLVKYEKVPNRVPRFFLVLFGFRSKAKATFEREIPLYSMGDVDFRTMIGFGVYLRVYCIV